MDGNQTQSAPPFSILSIEEIEQLPALNWLIEDVIPVGSLAVLYGEPNIGKSFVALDWAMSIASGQHWFAREVDQGGVLYVAAEGVSGLRQRVLAWKQHFKLERAGEIGFIKEAVQPLSEPHLRHLIDSLKECSSAPRLVIFDTFARAFVGGEENSAREVGAFIAAVDRIRLDTGAAVLLLHHSGKDASKEARGSTALRGAADTMIRLAKGPMGLAIECTKQKDAEAFSAIGLWLEEVHLAGGETSCVVRERVVQILEKRALTESERKILRALPREGATTTQWLHAAGASDPTYYRALKHFMEKGLVQRSGNGKGAIYTLTAAGRDAITIT